MSREQQDRLWKELSKRRQFAYKNAYNTFIKLDNKDSIDNYTYGLMEGNANALRDIFGEHNLEILPTYKEIEKEIGTIEGYEYSKIGQKERAIHKLLLTAQFLNKNRDGTPWKPKYSEHEQKWSLGIKPDDSTIIIFEVDSYEINNYIVYFRTEEDVRRAIKILGEDIIRTALTTDYY